MAIFEPDSHMALAYVTNQMHEPAAGPDTRGLEMGMASHDGVEALTL